ncbi:hypothetical protein LG307_10325 [Sutcliffiella horikoshii]|uniref:hypothetical protein n=1 Tax=Sutcliffiella horikoshii TaxID=79883 RepID=UPI003850AAE5
MSSMTGFINLVIIFGIIIFVFLLFTKGVKRIHITSSIKNNGSVLGGYMIILLGCTLIYFLMPDAENVERVGGAGDESGFILYERLMNKEKIEERYLSSKKTYNLSGQDLVIRSQDNYFKEYTIMFERTPDLEGRIDVMIYKGILFMEQFDLSDELPSPPIKFSNDILEVEHPAFFEKNMAYIAPEFPFTQFSGERSGLTGYGHSSRDAIIYVKVPEDVDVIWNEEFIHISEVK